MDFYAMIAGRYLTNKLHLKILSEPNRLPLKFIDSPKEPLLCSRNG